MPDALALRSVLIDAAYLLAAVLFILGLKRLSSPRTARSGNLLGATGMLLAVVATALHQEIVSFAWVLAGLVVGGLVGGVMARTVKMTAMPQMVALLNGFGGGASALVAAAEYLRSAAGAGAPNGPAAGPSGATDAVAAGVAGAASGLTVDVTTTIVLSALIGGATFSGSMIAFGKLQGIVTGRALMLPLQRPVHILSLLAALALGGVVVVGATGGGDGAGVASYAALNALALLLGVLLVLPIGGADMPVVVSLLNSLSGIAASMTGFVLHNNLLIIAGALVGASGLILTRIMCKAMNRSLANVLFAGFGADGGGGTGTGGDGGDAAGRIVREISPDDAAILLSYSRSVIFVPGYGMAVAQAQHQLRELSDMLEERGVAVKFAIHPVAGRMPGHMNVLLAEANVPYDRLVEMETINPEFERTEVAVVIGANDVVNPAARNVPDSPIYGMPILDVDRSQNVIIMKRSLSPGFAGIENELFYGENTRMLFGDARDSLTELVQRLKVGV